MPQPLMLKLNVLWRPTTTAKSLQSCPTLCNPTDGSPLGSPVPGILQARTLEWVAISFSNAWKWKVKVRSLSHVQLLATAWTAAFQAPLSMGFSRQEYWSGVPLPSPFLCIVILKKCYLIRKANISFPNKEKLLTVRTWSVFNRHQDGEPGGLPSMGSHRVGHDWSDLAASAAGK